jgi:ketosteroid isomerase-like protein
MLPRMKKWKLMLCAVLAGMLMTAWTAHADDGIKVIIEGEEVQFDKSPVADQGTTLVPFRALFEALGLEVIWDQPTKTVAGRVNGEVVIKMQIDRKTAVVPSGEIELAVAPRVIDGSTYVPLRVIGEATGRDVKWDGATRTITIGPAPKKGVDPATFYRAFVEANNAENLEAVMAAIHPKSPLLADGQFEAEVARGFEQFDVVTEIEELDVFEESDNEAVVRSVETSINTNGRFHMDNRAELALNLVKDEDGEWKIYTLQILGMMFLLEEDELTAEADLEADVKKAITDVLVANIEATEAEKLDAVLATIDPESPAYEQLGGQLGAQFLFYDLDFELELVNVIEVSDTQAYVYTVYTVKKIEGPEFVDSRIKQVHKLHRKEDGSWKVYISYTVGYEPLKPSQ